MDNDNKDDVDNNLEEKKDDVDNNLGDEKDEEKMQQGWVGLLKLGFCQHKLQLKEGKVNERDISFKLEDKLVYTIYIYI